MKIFLAGEGRTELGGWAYRPPYWTPDRGVLLALVEKVFAPDVVGAVKWKDIRKFKVGEHRGAEERNLLGARLQASEAGAEVLVFSRDRDRDVRREKEIEDGLASVDPTESPRIVGAVAVEAVESWVLSAAGVRGAEDLTNPKAHAADSGFATVEDKVDVIDRADLTNLPPDAVSLRRFLGRLAAIERLPSA